MFKLFTTSKNQQPVFRSQVLPADKVVGDSMFPKDRLSFEHGIFPTDKYVTTGQSQVLPADKVVGDSMFPKDRLSFEHSVFPPDHFVTPATASDDPVATVYQLPVNSTESVLDQAA